MKIIVVGNGKVGKTTLTIKFVKNIYTSEYKKTLARWNVDVIIWVYDENGDLCKIYK